MCWVNLSILSYNGIVRDPISIGNKTEGKVLAALADAGYQILLPFGSGCRYDLAFDDHGTRRTRFTSCPFRTCPKAA
jgi:hypothetical protein